ncbi:MAG: YraN family protein, partial [Cyanothece sp. SIO2G6]|nr:YraN family protein [Cyanothece sp. SIO2G6]
MTKSHRSRRPDPTSHQTIGQRGEELVSEWLQQLGWQVLHQRWRCRWGELDIVAQTPKPTPMIIVVEVKVRNQKSWDNAGLLAITPQKQRKLWQAAELFLAEHEDLADYPYRFDVALVGRKSELKTASMGSKDCDRSGSPVQGIPVPGPQIPKQPVPAEIMPKSF